MIKGCQKRMIYVKNTNSPYFEEAYFVLKNDVDADANENDIIREAQRIAAQCVSGEKRGKIKITQKKLTVILLSLSAAAFVTSVALVVACIIA